ncbi:hypothetical protein LPJ56_000675 [Coemansia sp. RSA 2599]|nr:hypothetical protein LPJ56_000675 [Coemansia sp. RSA 2599]
MGTVADAWERASGLMGGSHMDAHIGEIASRLCSVIPAGIETEEAGANEMPAVAEETDAWKSLLDDDGVLSRSGETGAGRQQQGAFERRILDSVWPSGDNVWSDQVDGDLVNAYLRLADMSIDKAGDATEDS